MKTAQDEWENFANAIGLADKSEVQQTEMRRSFFAGQFAFYGWQISDMAALPDREAEMAIKARVRELEEYFKANFQKRQ